MTLDEKLPGINSNNKTWGPRRHHEKLWSKMLLCCQHLEETAAVSTPEDNRDTGTLAPRSSSPSWSCHHFWRLLIVKCCFDLPSSSFDYQLGTSTCPLMDTSGHLKVQPWLWHHSFTFDLQFGVLSRTYVEKLDQHLDQAFPGRFSAVLTENVSVPHQRCQGRDDVTLGLYCIKSLKYSWTFIVRTGTPTPSFMEQVPSSCQEGCGAPRSELSLLLQGETEDGEKNGQRSSGNLWR